MCVDYKRKCGDGLKQISFTIDDGYKNKIQKRTIFNNFKFTGYIRFYQN